MALLDPNFVSRKPLSMSIDTWEMYRTTPNWMRERMMAVNHFHDPRGQFELAEVLLSEAIDDGDPTDTHLLSLLVNSNATKPLELDMGFGKYQRPNQPGSLIFASALPDSEIKGKGPFHSITFYISPAVLKQRGSEILGHDAPSFDVLHSKSFRDDAIEALLKRLLHEFQTTPLAGQRMSSDDLVDDIIRRLLTLANHRLPSVSQRDRLPPAAVTRAIDYMQAHFSHEISREELAGIAGVDPCHFTRLFRQTTGETPTRYLLQLRISHAKHLLKYGSATMSLNQIAAECGFAHQSHMGREFRRQVGTTPNLYRAYS